MIHDHDFVAEEAVPAAALRFALIRSIAWRSGSQIVAQLVTWAATFTVLRLLAPADYGLYAMTASVTVLLSMLSGASFANGLIRAPDLPPEQVRRMLGLLIVMNGGIAAVQLAVAPAIAAFYHQPLLAQLLRAQVLLYVANPPIALAGALLSRRLEFRKQAMANFAAALAGAGTALAGALLGLGVWTLVAAPIAMAWTRGGGLAIAARLWLTPSFRLGGMRAAAGFGVAMIASQLVWFVQTQSDVFIGGRLFPPAMLGLYTTALFLAQMLTTKFIPPINEVAFSAYARVQHEPGVVAAAFRKSVALVSLVALPFYAGMALTAPELVATVLGDHWAGTVPLVRLLACAMPWMALQIMFSPVTNALGRPWLAVRGAMAGAAIMPLGFVIGGHYGLAGLAWAWLGGFPLLTLYTAWFSLPVIGVRWRELGGAVAPALVASAVMVAAVLAVMPHVGGLPPVARLFALAGVGVAAYALVAAWLRRDLVSSALLAVRRRRG